jgi:alkanesulfonate monooxygenase SsuD/methylene tetrahydromethanopterin reductase-like flavin-dependent oxidoreductase (luciferase family)
MTPTVGEGSIEHLDWAQQARIARAAEAAGFEGIIPVGRYRGFSGGSRWSWESYDVIPWATGLAASTQRLQVFSTVHVPLIHPVEAAKELVTIDHVSGGRCALNIVAGWKRDEFEMFGITLLEHDDRYAQAAEWIEIIKRLWVEDEPFDFEGRFYTLHDAYSEPKPLQRPRPPIMNAGLSPTGREFAASHSDIIFIAANDFDGLRATASDVRQRATDLGREIEVWTTATLLCGETEADVRQRYDYFVHQTGDWATAEAWVRSVMRGGSGLRKSLTREAFEITIAGGAGPRLMGAPEQITEQMEAFVAAGINGCAIVCFDYERDIEMFGELVAPLAERQGLRDPSRRSAGELHAQ